MSAHATEASLREVQGPAALGGGARRFFDLLWLLSVTEFKRVYFGTVLGYLWSLVRPLMLFGVLLFVFTKVFRVGHDLPYYPVLLLLGIVLYTFFQEATSASVISVVAQEGVVRKTQFPRLVIPLASGLTCAFNLGLNLIVVFAFILAWGVEPTWTWLLFFLPLTLLCALAAAVGMALSVLYVRFRDVAIIWVVVAQVLFYATPILYPLGPNGFDNPTYDARRRPRKHHCRVCGTGLGHVGVRRQSIHCRSSCAVLVWALVVKGTYRSVREKHSWRLAFYRCLPCLVLPGTSQLAGGGRQHPIKPSFQFSAGFSHAHRSRGHHHRTVDAVLSAIGGG